MGVFFGNIVWPPTPAIGDLDGEVGPQNSLNTENVAPVSKRKLMGCPSTRMVTLDSWEVMTFIRRGVPGPHQSSDTRPKRSGFGLEFDPAPL